MTSKVSINPVSSINCHNRQKCHGSVTRGRVAEVLITPTECLNCDPVTPENDELNKIIFCFTNMHILGLCYTVTLTDIFIAWSLTAPLDS